ncbi:hypothetical protein XH99_09860 [Bradyrhizobium nanningense]|uniref:Uncharacterized protein n=1 Tax=Bradyrhizobium nanningense TaxID=1325118 RepID=A0A4Q0SCS4_9BRAD|nr:hypothetical protein XH99_09860 [Bradyrhizobium nanningense]RXH34498.1 hypothetical protein XH84_06800 [Bradyrhizobium nanningense]
MHDAARHVGIGAKSRSQVLKTGGGQATADFLENLSYNTIQERLVAFAMAPKQSNFSGMQDPRNIVTLLQ